VTAFGVPSRLPPGWRAEDYLARVRSDEGGFVTVRDAAEAMRVMPEEIVQIGGEGALAPRYEGGCSASVLPSSAC
jgi:hypothetical protein